MSTFSDQQRVSVDCTRSHPLHETWYYGNFSTHVNVEGFGATLMLFTRRRKGRLRFKMDFRPVSFVTPDARFLHTV